MRSVLFAFVFLSISSSLMAQTDNESIQQFQEETGAEVDISTVTDVPKFVRFPEDRSLRYNGEPEEKVDEFLETYGSIFKIEDREEELLIKDLKIDRFGNSRFTLEQNYRGIPIFDGQLHFHFNSQKAITAINGNYFPELNINPRPSITRTAAALIAIESVSQRYIGDLLAELYAEAATLYIFNPSLVRRGRNENYLVYEIEVKNGLDVHELVYVDAHSGNIVEQYSAKACALKSELHRHNAHKHTHSMNSNYAAHTTHPSSFRKANVQHQNAVMGSNQLTRELYRNNINNLVWQEGDAENPFPTGLNQWEVNELIVTEQTYYFFKNTFGWNSFDNNGIVMEILNNANFLNCPNAVWINGRINFCDGTASDDVVGHEWGHAYTEYTSNLLSAGESGSINEAYSDIWGETIDLLNNYEDAGEDNSVRTGNACSESNRWKIGEDAPGFNSINNYGSGIVRDMWSPNCGSVSCPCPAKVSDAEYTCSGSRYPNTGIVNHAYALMVDGGTYNGYTIAPIGFTKAAHIFWRAQSTYLTRTSDFEVLAYALEQSCQDLLGVNLEGLSFSSSAAGPSGEIITAQDYESVTKALLAVEMINRPNCNPASSDFFIAVPSICGTGTPSHILFEEDWESGTLAGWTLSQNPGDPFDWEARDWIVTGLLPNGRTGTAAFGEALDKGDCNLSLQNGVISLQSPQINISATATAPILMTFDHHVDMQSGYDGGQVYFRKNGGAWTLLPSAAFTSNPYNQTLETAVAGNNNPYAGQRAFTENGAWGQSQVDLSHVDVDVSPGDMLELRWDVSTNACIGNLGWYIDDILIYSCTSPSAPEISFSTTASNADEADANIPNDCLPYLEKIITVTVSETPSQPVDITLQTTGTATAGSNADYTFTPSSFTLDATKMSQDITVRIYNDASLEGEETVEFAYSFNVNGGNAIAGTFGQTHTLNITDDDTPPGNIAGKIILSEDFNGLFVGWTIIDGGDTNDTWYIEDSYNVGTSSFTLDGTNFLFSNSLAAGFGNTTYEEIESPIRNTQGMTNLTLTFDQFFDAYTVEEPEEGRVDIWDGTVWQNILTQTEVADVGSWSMPENTVLNIPDAYANANMKIRFTYEAEYENYWAIDNIVLTGDQAIPVQSTTNTTTGDEQYLGPNAEIYFFDPSTGNVMAKIKNLSSHDYGCTTVEVERAGTGASAAWGANTSDFIADKTFQITPANNNPTGEVEVSLYYTESEIAGWETTTGRSRNDLMLLRTPNDLPNPNSTDTRTYETETTTTYGTDWIYTATFETGFSDFGIGPVEPSVTVSPKVFLQGSFSGSNMADDLRNTGQVPSTEPYTALGYTHQGGGGESTLTSRLAIIGTKAVVDWVVVELRDETTPGIVVATRSALLLKDGSVVDTDGVSAVRFPNVTAGNYYVAIRHRNHLAVMTNTTVALN